MMRACSLLFLLVSLPGASQDIRRVERSVISFLSEAPMERITATNTASNGVFDVVERTFAVQVPVRSFNGFNSPLQKEHFNENYLESTRYPNIIFQGRVIESVNLAKNGTYAVRAKGEFKLHGITRERIIECKVVVTREGIRVTSQFLVHLADHDIRIPQMVHQKIAEDVNVTLDLLIGPQGARK